MAGNFEIYQDNSSHYRWCLRAETGRVVVTADDVYATKAEAIAASEAAKCIAADATVSDRTAAAWSRPAG